MQSLSEHPIVNLKCCVISHKHKEQHFLISGIVPLRILMRACVCVCSLYLRTLLPHRWERPSGVAGRSCSPPAWWQCCCRRDLAALSASAPRSHRSDAWRCRTPAGLLRHLCNTFEYTHLKGFKICTIYPTT